MTGATRPRICILTVTYNSASFIDEFAASVNDVRDVEWDLFVVDNGSSDDGVDRLKRQIPQATIIKSNVNLGFAGGNNIGILHCIEQGYDFILFLNNDTIVTPHFLSELLSAADAGTIVAPKVLYQENPALISTHAGDFDWNRGVFVRTFNGRPDCPAANRRRIVRTASFCCALAPTAAFEDVGLLDEEFFLYYEETDWIERARARGYRVRYQPSSVIYHRESGSSGGGWMTPLKLYYATRNRPYLVRKHLNDMSFYRFLLYFWLTRALVIARHLARGERDLARAIGLGVYHAFLGRMGRTMGVRDF